MPVVKFLLVDGSHVEVEATADSSVRDAAVGHMIEGIVGECGGNCSCATCHVIVDADWYERVGEPHSLELDLLSFLDDTTPTSRLSCQLRLSESLDGLVLRIPDKQRQV